MVESKQAERILMITRVLDAPRERVWRAWTDPELFKRWWGPAEYTAPTAQIDLRVGGRYVACMRSPEGKDYWSCGVYREIEPQKRLVFTDSFADEHGNVVPATYYGFDSDFPLELLVTVTLEDEGDKTRMTLEHAGWAAGSDKDMAGTGWSQSFDKLAAEIERTHAARWTTLSDVTMSIERMFDAPRELVYRAYTDPKLTPLWWGPGNLTTVVEEMDVRRGGRYRIAQQDAEGNRYVFSGEYREVKPPERLVATFEWDGAPGEVSVDDARFEDTGDGRTRLFIVSTFASKEHMAAMVQAGMEEGANEGYDRLARVVAALAEGRL